MAYLASLVLVLFFAIAIPACAAKPFPSGM
jgi:hypothetical protein